jgi:hypothetical protein
MHKKSDPKELLVTLVSGEGNAKESKFYTLTSLFVYLFLIVLFCSPCWSLSTTRKYSFFPSTGHKRKR